MCGEQRVGEDLGSWEREVADGGGAKGDLLEVGGEEGGHIWRSIEFCISEQTQLVTLT